MKSILPSFVQPRWLAGAALFAVLGGCGGGGGDGGEGSLPATPESMAVFNQQKLDWRACDQAFLGEELWKKQKDVFEPLGQRVQCTLMRAPVDYASPASGELQVALSRVAVEQPQQRMGAIFFNPGGPGGDGLPLPAQLMRGKTPGDAGDPAIAQFKRLSDRYELIGFSPRGTGAGTQLDCGAPVADIYSHSGSDLQRAKDALRLQAQACSANPLSGHLHTDSIARDMDLMRALLGEEKLLYIGYSWGATLGAWYASLFPERVGRMLLDSSTNVVANIDEISLLQSGGMVKLLEDMFLPYAIRHPLVFNLGESIAELENALSALTPKLLGLLFSAKNQVDRPNAIDWSGSHPQSIDLSLVHMNAVLGLDTLIARQPAADESQLRAAIAAHRFTPRPGANEVATKYAQQLVTDLFTAPDQSPKKFPAQDAVNKSIWCNDKGAADDGLYPNNTFTDEAITDFYCSYWPKSNVKAPRWAMAQKAGPILMLQSRHDAITPIEGARATLNILPNASMIVVENEFKHGLFPYGEECVDAQVVNYFLHGTMPARVSSCAGKPLRLDVEPYRDAAAGIGG